MKLLTVGDVVGEAGIDALHALLRRVGRAHGADVVILNGENAAGRGIIVADTKFEFGFIDGKLHIIDEVLTPDSSRFWPADKYVPGQGQPSFDKQYLRDWLKSQPWNMQPPAPALPQEIIDNTAARYREAYEILTGKRLTV